MNAHQKPGVTPPVARPTDARPDPSAPAQPHLGVRLAMQRAMSILALIPPSYVPDIDQVIADLRAALAGLDAPAQPQQPGGEEALVQQVGLAIQRDTSCSDYNAVAAARAVTATMREAGEGLTVRLSISAEAAASVARTQALEEAAQVCEAERLSWVADETPVGAHASAACRKAIRALIAAPPPAPSRDHLSTWREGVEAAAVVLDALGDHSHDKGTLPGALAALCASQCARHVRDFGAQGQPDLARPVPHAGAVP